MTKALVNRITLIVLKRRLYVDDLRVDGWYVNQDTIGNDVGVLRIYEYVPRKYEQVLGDRSGRVRFWGIEAAGKSEWYEGEASLWGFLRDGSHRFGTSAEDARLFLTMGWDRLEAELPYILDRGEKFVERTEASEIRVANLTRSLRLFPDSIYLAFRAIWIGRAHVDVASVVSTAFHPSQEDSNFHECEKWETVRMVYRVRSA